MSWKLPPPREDGGAGRAAGACGRLVRASPGLELGREAVIGQGQMTHLLLLRKLVGIPELPNGLQIEPCTASALGTPPLGSPVGSPHPLSLAHAYCAPQRRGVTCEDASGVRRGSFLSRLPPPPPPGGHGSPGRCWAREGLG